jgi:hypothetical protein
VRLLLTSIAIALIVLLTAALAAPMFVDWSSWRGAIESELGRRLGAPVKTAGQLEIRLLPTPYFEVDRLSVGGVFTSQAARFELALMSLASGQIRFAEIDLERPETTFPLGEGGAAPWPGDALRDALARVAVEKLVVRSGKVTLTRQGRAPIVIEGADFEASAVTLDGPFRGSGAANAPGLGRATFGFATAAFGKDGLPIKAEVKFAQSGVRALFDGRLAAAPLGKGWKTKISGAATFAGALSGIDPAAPTPWKAAGALTVDPGEARFDGLTLSLGPELHALEATGAVSATFAATPEIVVGLSAKQLNVDSLLRREGEDAAPPSRAAAALAALGGQISAHDAPPFRARLDFTTPALYLGAATLENVSLTANAEPGRPLDVALDSSLPGAGHLRLDGGFDFGAAPEFRGRMETEVADIGALGEWAARGEPSLADHARALSQALPYARMSTSGDLEASKVGFSIKNLAMELDKTKLGGAAAFVEPQGDARGRVYLDLSTDSLDLDEAPDLASGAFWIGDFDLTLSLNADRLRIAHAGKGAVESGSMRLQASRAKDKLSLDRLSIQDLGGASVEAEGEITPGSRWGRLKIDAAHLGDFAALAARVSPGLASRLLLARAESLSPAKATLEARREGEAKAAGFPFDFLTAEGEAGGTRFTLKLNDAPAPVSALGVDLNLEAQDGGALMRQLGYRAPAGSLGAARAALLASGEWSTGFDGKLTASLAGADIAAAGRFAPESPDPNAALLFGSASVKADNALTALVPLRLASAGSAIVIPVDLTSEVVLRGDAIAAPKLAGTVAGVKLAGALRWSPPVSTSDLSADDADVAAAKAIAGETQRGGGLTGELSLDKATLGALLTIPLGPPAPARAGARWSEAKFAAPLLSPPLGDVRLRVGALDLGDAGVARAAAARVRFEGDRFEISDLALDAAGAHVTGHAELRRDGSIASLSGALEAENLAVDRPLFKGKLGLDLDFVTSGASPSVLVAGLVGQGQLRVSAGALPRLDPGALERVVARAENPDAAIDETNVQHALALELDKQPLALPEGALALTLSSGALRAGPLEIAGPQRRASLSAGFDLRNGEASASVAFLSSKVGKYWSGPPPSITVSLSGAPDAPARRIDDAGLVAGLSAQAITREADRIAALEADIRERAYFNRRMKAEQFLEGRRREIAAYEDEQRRLAFEAERRRVEDALAKLNEQKKAEEEKRAAEEKKAIEDKKRAEAAAAAAPAAEKPSPPPPPPTPLALPAEPTDPTAGGLY